MKDTDFVPLYELRQVLEQNQSYAKEVASLVRRLARERRRGDTMLMLFLLALASFLSSIASHLTKW